jgi:excisionase family DNA binding protein
MNYLSPKKVALILDCSRRQASRLMANGTIPSIKIGTMVRVSEAALERYLSRLSRRAVLNVHNGHAPALHASNSKEIS